MVIRLTREVPINKNYRIIYFDNYYTSIPLMVVALYQKGILSVGTIRRNRIPNCILPDEQFLKKQIRGTSYEYITSYKGATLSNVLWKDNKLLTLMSTYCGVEPKSSINCVVNRVFTADVFTGIKIPIYIFTTITSPIECF